MKTHQPFRKVFFVAAAVFAGFLAQTTAANAEGELAFDGSKARVNLASKLTTLTQQIASASCRLQTGINADEATAELGTARNEFNTIMNGLENGSMALGIPSPEKHRVVLKSIETVRNAWQPLDEAAVTLVSGATGNVDAADTIANENLQLLEATNILMSDISGKYSNPHELTQADAMAMKIAGRQPMLGHRIAKDVCNIVAGTAQSADKLDSDLDTYSVSLRALRDGMSNAGINPPPNDVIADELEAVSSTWTETKQVLEAISGGMQPTADNVEVLASVSKDLTTDMNNVVTLYMLATPGQEQVYRVPLRAYAEEQLGKWLENEELIAAVRAQNKAHDGLSQAEIDQLDKDWRAQRKTDDKPLIDDLLNQPVSAWLRDQQNETANFVTEVFAMDSQGLNVAQSVETSDYWQGDEAKWQNTFGNGSGDIHISEVEYDESTGSYQSQVSMAITDPSTGELIGAITFGVNVQSLL
jgi:uncharacterized protein YoxC